VRSDVRGRSGSTPWYLQGALPCPCYIYRRTTTRNASCTIRRLGIAYATIPFARANVPGVPVPRRDTSGRSTAAVGHSLQNDCRAGTIAPPHHCPHSGGGPYCAGAPCCLTLRANLAAHLPHLPSQTRCIPLATPLLLLSTFGGDYGLRTPAFRALTVSTSTGSDVAARLRPPAFHADTRHPAASGRPFMFLTAGALLLRPSCLLSVVRGGRSYTVGGPGHTQDCWLRKEA